MTRIEDLVAKETDIIAKHFQQNLHKPVKLKTLFQRALISTIHRVVCSCEYEPGDPEREEMIRLILRVIKGASDAISLTAKLPVKLVRLLYPTVVKNAAQFVDEMAEITAKKIREHQETFDLDNLRDIIDLYLQGGKYELLGERTLAQTVSMLQLDAVHTLSVALMFAIQYTVSHPCIQSRIQQEIDDVVGQSRLPSLADRQRMPFTEATIWEVLRVSLPFPCTLFHSALQDTTIKGFNVPKGAQVIANLYAAHMDPEIFQDPDKFMPERFLDKDGKLSGWNKVMPFGLGEFLFTRQPYIFLLVAIIHRGNSKQCAHLTYLSVDIVCI